MINVGSMRKRFKLYAKDDNQRDDYGQPVGKILICSPWCSVKVLSDSEVDADNRTSNNRTVEFQLRYDKELGEANNPKSSHFIWYAGAEYDIVSVLNPRDMNERLIVKAVERG